MTALNLEIITPKGYLYNDKCHLVTLPTKDGEIGVMNGHESILTIVTAGIINIYNEQEILMKNLEISAGGYAKMHGLDRLVILLDN
jgi:F-type H+-transporting ATPase subunit epsilon